MLYLPYGLSDSCLQIYLKIKITIQKKMFLSIPHPFLFSFCPSFSISLSSIISPFRLHSVFFPSLSHFATSIPHVLNCLSLLIAHSAPSFLSFRPVPVFSFLVPTSKSRHHFSFFSTLSPQVLRNFLCHIHTFHTSCCIWIFLFFSFFLACLCLCPFHSALHLSIFLLLLIFPLFH
jgi:hypothetical protein